MLEILEQRLEVAACPNDCDGSMVTAPALLQILPKIFLSYLAISKLDDRQALYHLERQLKERHGIHVSRQTMARWLIALTEPLRPILEKFNAWIDEIYPTVLIPARAIHFGYIQE